MNTCGCAVQLAVLALAAGVARASAAVTPNGMFTDGAVLQQAVTVPVWGAAEPGEEVTVEFAGQKRTAKADAEGKWMVRLDPLSASTEPRTMVIRGRIPNPQSEIRNILVGEVWICSGQSNMGMMLGRCEDGTNTARKAADPLLRFYRVPAVKSDAPLCDVRGRWSECKPETAVSFSGVAFYFGQALRLARPAVPVGLVWTAWGGTPAEAWTPREALEGAPALKAILDTHAKAVQAYDPVRADTAHRRRLAAWSNAAAKAREGGQPIPRKPQAPQPPAERPQRPSALYNAMIAPLAPYALRGAIWYQGEANARRATEYETLLPALIGSWRKAWGGGDFPFLFVQVAPFQNMTPELRESQLVCWRKTTNTAVVIAVDVGEEHNVHPPRKQPVGERLALAARAIAYGEKVEYVGPVFKRMRTEAERAILEFEHTGGGLVARGGELKDFTVAGADGRFVPARATVDGDRVVVTSPDVGEPKAVRYGWIPFFTGTLFGRNGLPASSFRTDRPLP